ncbi:MAG: hypothetical protein ABIA74_04520 [bacterium]
MNLKHRFYFFSLIILISFFEIQTSEINLNPEGGALTGASFQKDETTDQTSLEKSEEILVKKDSSIEQSKTIEEIKTEKINLEKNIETLNQKLKNRIFDKEFIEIVKTTIEQKVKLNSEQEKKLITIIMEARSRSIGDTKKELQKILEDLYRPPQKKTSIKKEEQEKEKTTIEQLKEKIEKNPNISADEKTEIINLIKKLESEIKKSNVTQRMQIPEQRIQTTRRSEGKRVDPFTVEDTSKRKTQILKTSTKGRKETVIKR